MDDRDGQFHKKLLSTFKVEAEEHVRTLSSSLIELEHDAPAERRAEIVEAVFREAHSFKGAARAVGVTVIETVCQALESVFAALKSAKLGYSQTLFDVLHDAVDALGRFAGSVGSQPPDSEKGSTSKLLRRLDAVLSGGVRSQEAAPYPADGAPAPSRRGDLPIRLEEKVAPADTVRISTAKLDKLLFQAEGLLASKLTSEQRAIEIRDAIDSLTALKRERAKVLAGAGAVRRGGGDRADGRSRKLVEFMAWEGAYVRSFEARLDALADRAERDHRALAATVDGLLGDTKRALMLPLSSLLELLPKLVRDLSRAQGKEAELVVRGVDIELDRRILEEMRDPLIHLVRNCLDHGIEPPAVRIGKGKRPAGEIAFTVAPKNGSKIEISISDDGAGIDLAKVEAAALKLGIVQAADSRDRQELVSLVFHSGLSTSPIITDISGRGLGLAIVRERVERLGGVISVETQPDRGTTFRIVLPLTLATFRGVRVRVGDLQFVLPTTRVEQAVRLKKDLVKTIENRETILWNGRAVALVRLADVLELPAHFSAEAQSDSVQIILLASDDTRIAFGVDEIIEEQEVLVKSLGRQLSRVRNVAGATVLGTGKALPILDVRDLLKSAVKLAAAPAVGRTASRETKAEAKSILVVEDSVTSRALLKNILESAGYRVSTAIDGTDAFVRMKEDSYDLIVSDVEMPRMNGFDLTARIRADKALGELPVVLVTALDSRQDRERGIDVGADAYIVKSSFDQSNLLDVVRRLI
jgi:two-component system, chemotaxis family, sensor kinase CheA